MPRIREVKKRFYTTFEIGEICGVFPSTVINWIKDGRIKASYTPGGHRRVVQADLLEFMKKLGYPIPLEMGGAWKRILIVDDEKTVCRMIQRAFRDYAALFKTETLSSGIDALVEIGKSRPDLVILDVVMPVIDGASLCASLKANPVTRDIKLIGITGKRLPGTKLRFIKKNTDAFFRKPLDIQKLLAKSAFLLRVSLKGAHEGSSQ